MRIIVVNEKDEVIGSKGRENIQRQDIYRVSALWLTNFKGQFLLAQRSFHKNHHPGCWGPAVAGTVEDGESYEENIYKEINEELGLKNILLHAGAKMRITGEHNHFTQWFTVTLDKDISTFVPSPEEVAQVRWFSREDFNKAHRLNPSQFIPQMKQYVELFQPS